VSPEAQQNQHQQETAEGQPETSISKSDGGCERSHRSQEKEYPPYHGPRRWENVGVWLQTLFNFLVMLFTGGLFYLTYGQLQVAREATEATKRAADAAIIAAQVAPGQEARSQNGASFPEGYIAQKTFTMGASPVRLIKPIVVGCVSYQSTVSSHRYVTGFVYEVFSTQGGVQVGENVPVENISLHRSPFAGASVD